MESEGRPRQPWTASGLAEVLPCSSDTIYNRLRELETIGKIETKKVGARARIWWVANTETVAPAPDTSEFRSAIDEGVIEAMASRPDQNEAWTTGELEGITEYDQDSIYNRLRELQDDGYVDSLKVGARARVWWIAASRTLEA